MFRAILCSLLLISAVTGNAISKVSNIPDDVDVQVIFVDDISKLENLKQGAELIPMKADFNERLYQIRYTLGNRVSGDSLVSQGSNSYSYSSPQDIRLTLRYPASGTGAMVTYVEIIVNQNSSLGQAYVTSGGIGQRTITIVVEAYNTNYFSYSAKFYGRW